MMRLIRLAVLLAIALPLCQIWNVANYARTRPGWRAKIAAVVAFTPVFVISNTVWISIWTIALWAFRDVFNSNHHQANANISVGLCLSAGLLTAMTRSKPDWTKPGGKALNWKGASDAPATCRSAGQDTAPPPLDGVRQGLSSPQ